MRNTDLVTSSGGAGNAGNIIIQNVDVLLLRQGSLIQAGASASGDGGNIDIDAGLVITVVNEDNDILADTNSGRGGDIQITTQQILGFREVGAFSNELRGNGLNDISARSESGVDGQVSIDNFAVDPNQGLATLPADVSDPANQIAQGCSLGDSAIAESSPSGDFIITGRGGQPLSPTDIAGTHAPLDDLGPELPQAETAVAAPDGFREHNSQVDSTLPTSNPLADAQEAVMTEAGEVFLVTEGVWQSSLSCASLH